MIFSYEVLVQFRNARFNNKIITFDNLLRERNLTTQGEELHCWVAKKDKRDYLISDEKISTLPRKIENSILIREDKAIYHFITKSAKVGFTPEKHYSFRELIDLFCSMKHTNNLHQRLLWLIAVGSLLTRINCRIAGNIELGKDSTFNILGYLTNAYAVFDKPRTLAKLEFGLNNKVLVINEVIMGKEEERQNIHDYLLSIGSLSPTYHSKSRATTGKRENYDINNFSLVICYNHLNEIAEKDKQNYFDFSFGKNILERFIAFKLNGKLDIAQFRDKVNYNTDIDYDLLKIARTLEWYKQNWRTELKPFSISTAQYGLSERQQEMVHRLAEIISLYAETPEERDELIKELLNCNIAYRQMVLGNNILQDFNGKKTISEEVLEENPDIEVIEIK